MKNIEKFIEKFGNESLNMDNIHLIYGKESDKIYRVGAYSKVIIDSSPTLVVNETHIVFNMNVNISSSYLNQPSLNKVKEFSNILDQYVDVYNKLRPNKKEQAVRLYLKISYDNEDGSYSFSIISRSNTFKTYQETIDPDYDFKHMMFNAIRCDPDEPMTGEMLLTSPLIVNDSRNLQPNMILLHHTNENIIYSSKGCELNNMFTLVDGLYQPHELFTAIQSYLDLTENDNCNILDPKLIKDKVHLNNLILIKRMENI